MLAIVHMLTGALIGAELHNNAAIVVVAFLSHYLLDAMPHIDPDTFVRGEKSYNYKQVAIISIDTITTVTFVALFYHYNERWLPVLIGGIAAQLPDFLMPLERYPLFAPLKKIHRFFHWNVEHALQWKWYIIGISTQVAISIFALWLIGWR